MANALQKLLQKTKTPSESKSSVPEVKANVDEAALIKDILRLSDQQDDLKLQIGQKEDQLRPLAQAHRLHFCELNGEVVPSVKLVCPDDKTAKLTFIQADAYKKIKDDQIDIVKSIAGEQFESYFKEITEFKIDVDALTEKEQDALGKALARILGDRFAELVQAPRVAKPKASYTRDRLFANSGKFKTMADNLEREGLVSQNSPYFK